MDDRERRLLHDMMEEIYNVSMRCQMEDVQLQRGYIAGIAHSAQLVLESDDSGSDEV